MLLACLGPLCVVLCVHAGTGARAAPADGGGPSRSLLPGQVVRPAVGLWSRALASAGVDGDPLRWARLAIAVTLGLGLLATARSGPAGGITVVIVAAGAVVLGLRATCGRGLRRADRELPDLLEHAARGLRSGLDLVPALGLAAAAVGGVHGAELGRTLGRVDLGAPLVEALVPWAEDHPRPPVRMSVAALEVAATAGGARARALDGIAATLRSRTVVAEEAGALATQARASAAVMVALPVVVAGLGSAADPRLAHALLGTPVGLACVTAAALLDGAGAWWMQRVVDGAGQ